MLADSVDGRNSALFVTGGSGFVGRRALQALADGGVRDVRLLVRDVAKFSATFAIPAGWQCVHGSLEDADAWQDALHGVDTIVHLASSTGKVSRGVHHEVIVRGTERLLAAAKRASVRRLLLVSSVAAGFADRSDYPYAESKYQAELRVLSSALEVLVLRPTMVFGPGSAVYDGMRRMASLPVPIVFGNGTTRVQPIHVDDLAALLMAALAPTVAWHGETLTVGGPDTVTVEELLRRIRAVEASGQTRFLHIPMEPLRTVLALLEPLLLPVLPFTAGQLSTFANTGDAGRPPALLAALLSSLPRPMHNLDAMLSASQAVRHAVRRDV